MEDFSALFDKWAHSYDETIDDPNHEYQEVFAGYNQILENVSRSVSDEPGKLILDIGIGTGNLSRCLVERGHLVVGIEPSSEMRKIAANKLSSGIAILDGHFLSIPLYNQVDGIVSSYAFHHLNYPDKIRAANYLDGFLKPGGRIVIADTMFSSENYKHELFKAVKQAGASNLWHDLNTEYYELLEDITQLFRTLGYSVHACQMNKYVWIVTAQKGGNSHD